MSCVFAETYCFVALSNPRDSGHADAVEYTASFRGEMVTTAWVLTEFANHMSDPRNRAEFMAILAELRASPQVLILPPDVALFEEGLDLFAARPDKEWSLTDCISFAAMIRVGITEALTADRHFEQSGFTALLK